MAEAPMLYIECESGISGDMFVAALLDLGASEERLRETLASLPVDGFDVRISRVRKSGLDACDFDVRLDAVHENHDHDMRYLYGSERASGQKPASACEHAHEGACGNVRDHAHDHAHDHDSDHTHEHRGLSEVEAVITAASMSDAARAIARRIFGFLVRAEAKAHGVPESQVHFHEVGAVDSIVDVVSAAVCLDDIVERFGVRDVVVGRLREGRGSVRCQHGVLPVPVPAVVNIVVESGLPLSLMPVEGEFVTPTGAAIAAAVRTRAELPEGFAVRAMGLGAGKREYERPSLLRAMLIEGQPEAAAGLRQSGAASEGFAGGGADGDLVWKLEADVDDCTGEALAFTLERLYDAGAREAHFLPCFMKKGRPGYQVQALCGKGDISALEAVLFENSTTIGVRRVPMQRTVLPREAADVATPYGPVRMKRVVLPGGEERAYPEYDSVSQIAHEQGASYQAVYRAAAAASERPTG